MLTSNARRPAHQRAPPSWTAIAVPTRTGATDAARVAGRTADHQTWNGLSAGVATGIASGPLGKLREVRRAFLNVCVATLLGFLAHVVEERRVARQLLDAGEPVVGGVHAGLDHAQRQRAQLEDAAAPYDRFFFEVGQRDNLVDQAHIERLLGVVLLTEEPDLTPLLLADSASQ